MSGGREKSYLHFYIPTEIIEKCGWKKGDTIAITDTNSDSDSSDGNSDSNNDNLIVSRKASIDE